MWKFISLVGLIVSNSLLFAAEPPQAKAKEKAVPADHAERMKRGTVLFQQSVRDTLVKHCLDCHGGAKIKGDFDLSTRESLADSGMIELYDCNSSQLVKLIEHAEEPKMPFKAPKLSEETIKAIKQWIDLGAPYDRPLVSAAGGKQPKVVTDEDRKFWSFLLLKSVRVPSVTDEKQWAKTDIDRFILHSMHTAQVNDTTKDDKTVKPTVRLFPNPLASRRVLIRRASFDLIGLPPQPEEVDKFVADPDPQAYEKLIDRLLESPQYGERWARHWLDVARFAESHGYEQDYDRPHAWHYRDFVIKALNADMPFNQFVRWQLAGDELAPTEPLALAATGFLGAGMFPTQLTETEFESARYDELDDMTATTGVAFLGLSIGCARCHDHKFDPIPARDYYRFAAAFTKTIRSEIDVDLQPEETSLSRDA